MDLLTGISPKLLARVAKGEDAAIGALAAKLYEGLPEEMQDALERALLKLIPRVRASRHPSASKVRRLLRAWIAGSQKDAFRSAARYREILSEKQRVRQPCLPADPGKVAQAREECRLVLHEVLSLAEPAQTVIWERLYSHHTYKETTRCVRALFDASIAESTVRSIFHRARRLIRDRIREHQAGDNLSRSRRR